MALGVLEPGSIILSFESLPKLLSITMVIGSEYCLKSRRALTGKELSASKCMVLAAHSL